MKTGNMLYRYFPLAIIGLWQFMAFLRMLLNSLLELFGLDATFAFEFVPFLGYCLLAASFVGGFHLQMRRGLIVDELLTPVRVPLLRTIAFTAMCAYLVTALNGALVPTALSSLIVAFHLFACIHAYYTSGLKKSFYLLLAPALLVPFLTGSKSGLLQVAITALLVVNLRHFRDAATKLIALSVLTIPLGVGIRTAMEGGDFSVSLTGFLAVLNRFHGAELTLGILADKVNIDPLRIPHLEYAALSGLPTFLDIKPVHPGTALSLLFGYPNEFFVALGTFGGALLLAPFGLAFVLLFAAGILLGMLRRRALAARSTLRKAVLFYLFIEIFYVVLEGSYFLTGLFVTKVLTIFLVVSLLLAMKPASRYPRAAAPLIRAHE